MANGAKKTTKPDKRGARKRGSGDAPQLQAEKSLRQFRLALDNSADMILLIDRKTMRYVDVNQTACKLLGYTREELLKMGPQDLLPDNQRELAQGLDELIAHPSSVSGIRSYFRCRDGSTIPFESTRQVLRSGDNFIIAAICRDITERKQAEAARTQLAAIVASSNDAIISRGLDDKILSWNAGAERLFGYTADEAIGRSVSMIFPSDRADEIARNRARLAQGMAIFDLETERLAKGGQRVAVSLSQSPIKDEHGVATGVALVFRDNRERKQTEATLRESEARYRSVIAAIAEGVVLRDQNGLIIACNASVERILGRTLDQMKGKRYFDPSWEVIRENGFPFPETERPVAVALRTGRLQSNIVLGFRKPNGTVLWLLMNVQPMFDESGTTLSGIVSTLTDITERKRDEVRRTMEHAVTRVLAEAETTAEAIPRINQTICESLGWACGAYWRWDGNAQVLRCTETWHVDAADVADFIATASTTINEAPAWHGEAPPKTKTGGLVRRVWMDGAPVWFPDVTREPGFRRGLIAAEAGLHCAFGFPVMTGAQPLGVMEFYSRDIEKPDEALLQVVQAIGSQIGQFMARKQAEERIRHLADYDELTGLPNRSMFQQRLHHALAQAQRHARPLALLFIDLDHFKNINDDFGHEAGDSVLKEFAERLRGCLRDSDTVGRLGGDEFIVLMEELPRLADAAAVAQKILDAVARPFLVAAQESHIGASIGISACPEDGKDMQTLLKHADVAMYRAKERGRNNYQFYLAQMTAPSTGISPGV